MVKIYSILQSTNFMDCTNAKVRTVVKCEQEDLRKHIEHQFEKLKAALISCLGEDETFEDRYNTNINGMCYSIEENCDDMVPLIYEVYATPLTTKTVLVTDIKWDTDGESVDLPCEVFVDVPLDADGNDIINKVSDEYGWCIFSAAFHE